MSRLTVVGLATLVVALLSTAIVLAADEAAPPAATRQPAADGASQPARVAGLAAAFGELASVPPDTSPFAERLRHGLEAITRDRFPVLRRVSAAGGRDAYIAIGEAQLCLVVREPSGAYVQGCASAESAADPRTPLVASTRDESGATAVTAVLPSAVQSVRVTAEGGASTAPRIQRNIASVELVGPASALEVATPDGPVSVGLEER